MRFWTVLTGTIMAVVLAVGWDALEGRGELCEVAERRTTPWKGAIPQGVPTRPQTFAIETYVARGYNYLDNMVDAEGLPYFDVFWTDPAQAAHDWPDLGDVMARQWQTAIMARHLTGRPARARAALGREDRFAPRPQDGTVGAARQALLAQRRSAGRAGHVARLAILHPLRPGDGLRRKPRSGVAPGRRQDDRRSVEPSDDGFGLSHQGPDGLRGRWTARSPRRCWPRRATWSSSSSTRTDLFTPDNKFRAGAQMHGSLRTLLGAADYALYVHDPVLFSRVDALYRYGRSQGTRFGYLPENVCRKGDVTLCETCALMDFIGLAATLANNGHPEYWGDVERMVRNHLVESQVVDGSWLKPEKGSAEKGSDPFCAKHPSGRSGKRGLTPFPPDTDQFTCRQVGERMVGGYAGWSSPVHILAACETLHWGGPELRNKTRAFQNCCGGSGTHGFYIAWKNAARFEDGTLSVNLHIDKLLPEAEIRGYQPYKGLLTIDLKRPCKVRVRIPEFVEPGEMKVESRNDLSANHALSGRATGASGRAVQPRVWGNYLELGDRQAGQRIEVSYPLPLREETESVGNPGFRQYQYRVAWRGDTVVRLTPVGEAVKQKTGYSEYAHKQVPIFFGAEGPGPLYQREHLLHETADPTLTPLNMDDGRLDFWSLRGERGERSGERGRQGDQETGRRGDARGRAGSRVSLPLPPLSAVQALADQLPCTVDFFEVAGCRAFLIRPRGPSTAGPLPWVWYAPVIDNPNPTHAWMLRQWLAKGIGMAGVDVGESFGNPRGRAVFTKLWETLRAQYHADPRPCLLPQSRGGLMLYNWAAENPDRVACIAGIYPVCDLRSFPRLERACAAYGLTAAELRAHLAEHNPIDRLAPLAKANVPILHVHGETDRVVPIEPNSAELARRYRALGGTVRLIVVPHQGHQESDQFFHCQELVDFVIANLARGPVRRSRLPDGTRTLPGGPSRRFHRQVPSGRLGVTHKLPTPSASCRW